jgi:hypothetical protein
MTRGPAAVLTAAVLLAATAAPAAPPDLNGKWRLDPQRSDGVTEKIGQAAGANQVKSGGATGLTIIPEANTRSEVERVEMREWMLGRAAQLGRIEIVQTADEVKIYTADDEGRIFYLNREHMREDGQHRMLKCRARVEGAKIRLEETGGDRMKVIETLTPVPANNWLVYALRFEHKLLKEPLQLRLLYVKETAP